MPVRLALAALILALSAAAPAAAAPVDYVAPGGTFTGVKPTAVGLPQIGIDGTAGAGELAGNVREYHDSGAYATDVAETLAAAQAYLGTRLDQNSAKPARTCRTRFVKTRKRLRGKRLFRKVRRCKAVAPPRLTGKPAVVLDIDETTLSNYAGLSLSGFTAAGAVPDAVAGTGTALAPTLALFKAARERGVDVFFITGRPEALRATTERNLRAAGFDGWTQLVLKPSGIGTLDYKAGERRKLAEQGYDVVVNVGDQESDLDGGFADRAFKVPNPFYFISD